MQLFACPSCRKSLLVPAELQGRQVRCPGCGQIFALPGNAQPPPAERWFYARARQKIGPLSWAELQQAARGGQFLPEDMVLRKGTNRWVPANSVEGLFPAEPAQPATPASINEPLPRQENQDSVPAPKPWWFPLLEKGRHWWPILRDQARRGWQVFLSWPPSYRWAVGGSGASLLLLIFLWAAWPTKPTPGPNTGLPGPDSDPKQAKNDRPSPRKELPSIPGDLAANWVRDFNGYRRLAGLKEVSIDTEASAGCEAHARYLAYHPSLKETDIFDEDPGRDGFSDQGRRAAQNSLVFFAEPRQALDEILASLFHRVQTLDPWLQTIGLGIARNLEGQWITVVDVRRGRGEGEILFPADGQKDVPLHFSGGSEIPGPINKQNAGFPVSVTFPPVKKITQVQATLLEEKTPVEVYLFTPEKPVPSGHQRNSICLIPRAPLKANTTYQVKLALNLDGKAWQKSWHFTTSDDFDEGGIWAKKALNKINEYRKQVGLEAVALDADLTRGCRNHARYLVINLEHPATQGLGAHEEDLKLPGASEEGQRAGRAGNISLGDYNPLEAIDGWMATLYHRVPILDPRLQRIGFSSARGPRLGWISVLDVVSGREKGMLQAPLLYPAEGQNNVPLFFPPGGEIPDPIPENKTGKAGFPITATFPANQVPQNARGILQDDAGREVAVWFSSPEKPANPKFSRHQGNTICLIPQAPLRPQATYQVKLEGELAGQAWTRTWQFTTGAEGLSPEQGRDEVLQKINECRAQAGLLPVSIDAAASKGCEAHARYLVLNSGLRGTKQYTPNDEDSSLPGFTLEGQEAARRTDVFFNAPTPVVQIDTLVAGFFRRTYLLDPALRSIGYGCSLEVGRGWIGALDLNTGRDENHPVLYPAPGQENVPLAGLNVPHPQEGFPITATFPPHLPVQDAQAGLADAAGKTYDIFLSAPDRPLHKDRQGNTICILPQEQLLPGTIYQVTMSATVNGQPWRQSWRFASRK